MDDETRLNQASARMNERARKKRGVMEESQVMKELVRIVTVRDVWDSLTDLQKNGVARIFFAVERDAPLPNTIKNLILSFTPDQAKGVDMMVEHHIAQHNPGWTGRRKEEPVGEQTNIIYKQVTEENYEIIAEYMEINPGSAKLFVGKWLNWVDHNTVTAPQWMNWVTQIPERYQTVTDGYLADRLVQKRARRW